LLSECILRLNQTTGESIEERGDFSRLSAVILTKTTKAV